MKFKMNNHTWEIIDVTRQEIKDIYKAETNDDVYYLYGLSMIGKQIIYLNKDINPEKKRKTLMHELMHCYKAEYVSLSIENIDEELLCDLSANSHDIIHEIVEKYFEKEKPKWLPIITEEPEMMLIKKEKNNENN